MLNESALKDTLLALAEQHKSHYIMMTAILNELAALRETVRGLDPTFGDVMEARRLQASQINAQIEKDVIAGYDEIIQKLMRGYVC